MTDVDPPPPYVAPVSVEVVRGDGRAPRVAVSMSRGASMGSVELRAGEATQLAAALVTAAWEAVPPRFEQSLTLDEFALMARLMRRFANSDMDQWEAFVVSADHGPIYVGMLREVPDPDAYVSLDGFLAIGPPTE